MHFYAGVLVAPLLAISCLTGLIFACTPTLDRLVYRHEFTVGSHRGSALPLASQVRAARRAHPEGRLVGVEPPSAPDRTTGVDLRLPNLPDGAVRTVFVDPYTGAVRGTLTMVGGRPPLQQWVWTLHGRLHGGTVGRWYSETAVSWLPVLLVGGLALWIGRRRTRRRDLVPTLAARPGRPRTRCVHAGVGMILTVGLAGITVTGLTWSHYAGSRFEQVLDALHGHAPTPTAPPVAGGGPRVSVDRIQASARSAGLDPTTITYPDSPTSPYLVADDRDHWPIRRSTVVVNPHDGSIMHRTTFAEYPLLAQLTTIGIRLHEGLLFGAYNQIALALLAIGCLVLLGAGCRMWWLRRAVPGRRFAPPPARGAWRTLPTVAVAVGLPVVVAVGWLLPTFGITLAGFVVFDVLCGHLSGHRRRAGA